MSSSILQESRFADVEDFGCEAVKQWDMGSAMLQEGRFADIQGSRFQFAKIFNGNVLQEGRLATSQKSHFQVCEM